MSLRTFFSEITHREYRTWVEYLNWEQEQPSRSDSYLMQIAAEVRRVLSKKPSSIKLEHFRLRREKDKPKVPERTVEQSAEVSKARWYGLLGRKRDG